MFDAWRECAAPATTLADRRAQWDRLQLLSALEGLANRKSARLYVNLIGDKGSVDRFWWRWLSRPGGWMAGVPVTHGPSVDRLIEHFRREVRGVAVWDERTPSTSNVASSFAGAENLLPLRYDPAPGSLYSRLVVDPGGPRLRVIERMVGAHCERMFGGPGVIPGTRIPSTGSAKCDAYLWAAQRLLRTRRTDVRMGYYPDAAWLAKPLGLPVDRTLLSNHDYFVAHKGFFFDLDPWDDEAPDDELAQKPGTDASVLRRILRSAYLASRGAMIHVGGFVPWDQKYTDYTHRAHGGVATEWRYAEILSCFNAYMDADAPGLGPMANASFFQHYPTRSIYRQAPLPTDAEMKRRGWIEPTGMPANRPFACFYAGDFDSAAWLYRMLPELWQDSARGSVPLGWAFDPNLQDRFPVGLAFARETATPNDAFVTGDSGAGYLNPGYLTPPRKWSGLPSGLGSWIAHSTPLYRKWDLSVTGFVIDGNAPPMAGDTLRAYAKLSPGGVVAQKIPAESLVDGVAFLRMGPDLSGDLEKDAQTIESSLKGDGPKFGIFRTVLWKPSLHAELVRKVAADLPQVAFVTPPVLMELLRRKLAGPAHTLGHGQSDVR